MPVPLGKKDNPTKDSIVDDLPALWLPNTTIWGRESSASVAPSVAASCWSRASVSTTAPSTTRVGCSCVAMWFSAQTAGGRRKLLVSSPLGFVERVEACRCDG